MKLDRNGVVQIAAAQKTLRWTLLFAIFATVGQCLLFQSITGTVIGMIFGRNGGWTGVLYLMIVIPQVAAIGQFCSALHVGWTKNIWIVTQLIPVVSLVALAFALISTSSHLKSCGLRVSWFGVTAEDLAAYQVETAKCAACGEEFLSSLFICPMCGKSAVKG